MGKHSNTYRICLLITYGDRERLRKYYPTVPYTEMIRRLTKAHLDGLDRQLERLQTETLPELIEEID